MPTVTDTLVDAWASCHSARCEGYKQQPVQAVQTLTEFSFVDLGGDLPGTERSTTLLRFANPEDVQCPHCGEPRFVADQVRPIYPNISGQPQDYLLHQHDQPERVRELELANAKAEAQMAQMQVTLERQAGMVERLLLTQGGTESAPPRTKGRPVKDDPQA